MAAKLKMVDGRPTAAALFAEADKRCSDAMLPSDEALKQLDDLFNGNSARSKFQRVSADRAIDLLKAYGWTGGRQRFDKLVRSRYGKGWGQ